ncbi:hypothetical protein BN946_scf184781.g7 [Trametes cinnabarina]|uniref:AAA+ ATPase domain-containing protein n=1 Tax=Pycnoporus cinnabarinus TaxID=5643 RepID=A0A060SPY6_PYCCI|nr:hypothetical protein BN946_scf184781.g7 [Trametes cinnabarina]
MSDAYCADEERQHSDAEAIRKPVQQANTTSTALWVDRYKPRRFTELLGDDRVHREVLAWVKEWDCCVFGKGRTRGKKRTRGDEDGENLDEWQRPKEKLLLLSGPPGLGKTTLAHIVAQHAGYEVFEINASDARSADVVDQRIRPALESGAKIGSSRPNLVVIDEIDGATGGSDNSGGFIHRLVQLVQERPTKRCGLVEYVCHTELTGAQMLKARNKDITESMVRSATQGMKEAEASQMTVLNDLFAPPSRKRAKELGIQEDEARFVSRLSREVEGCGSTDKVALGCFEHYALLHRHDGTLTRYVKGTEWLCTYDSLAGAMRTDREYSLMPYLVYPLVAFYPLFQERGSPKAERPKADWEVIRPAEKALLARLVNIMATLELRFVQEKNEDGQLVYRLDPPIDVFVTYDGKRAADIAVSRYAVRHLVAAEIDAQVIARQADVLEKVKGGKSSFFSGRRATVPDEELPAKKRAKQDEKPSEKVAVDFFGRPIEPKEKSEHGTKGANAAPKAKPYRVAFKFNEGNSAAVRKPVKVSAFL